MSISGFDTCWSYNLNLKSNIKENNLIINNRNNWSSSKKLVSDKARFSNNKQDKYTNVYKTASNPAGQDRVSTQELIDKQEQRYI